MTLATMYVLHASMVHKLDAIRNPITLATMYVLQASMVRKLYASPYESHYTTFQ